MASYTCGRCGYDVGKSAKNCPHCGARLGNIHCKNCGFSGTATDFKADRCPNCRTVVTQTTPKKGGSGRCTACGHKLEPGQWTCPNCGHTQWAIVLALGVVALACILFAVVYLPLPTAWTVVVGGLGVLLFYSAFYGVGGALRWRGWTTFLLASLLLIMVTLSSLAARYRYSPTPVIRTTPDTVVVAAAAALTDTPEATSTRAPTLTPIPTSTPTITAVVNSPLVNVRAEPSTEAAVVGGVVQDEIIMLLGRNADGTWLKMKTQRGVSGWVFTQLVTLTVDLQAIPVAQDGP